jgi:hypothetical protein
LTAEVLLLHQSSFDVNTYAQSFTVAVLVGFVAGLVPKHLPTPGAVDVVSGSEMLTLVQNVDRAYDKKGAWYIVKVAATAEPLALLVLLLGDFVFTISYLGFPSNDKLALGVALVALTIAMGSFSIEYIQSNVSDKLDRMTEEHVLHKVIESSYAKTVYPIIRAVVRERLNYRGSKLEDVYNLDHTLFEPHVLLEKLLD